MSQKDRVKSKRSMNLKTDPDAPRPSVDDVGSAFRQSPVVGAVMNTKRSKIKIQMEDVAVKDTTLEE